MDPVYIITTNAAPAVFPDRDAAFEAVHTMELDNMSPVFIDGSDGVRVYVWGDADIVGVVALRVAT